MEDGLVAYRRGERADCLSEERNNRGAKIRRRRVFGWGKLGVGSGVEKKGGGGQEQVACGGTLAWETLQWLKREQLDGGRTLARGLLTWLKLQLRHCRRRNGRWIMATWDLEGEGNSRASLASEDLLSDSSLLNMILTK